MNRARNYMLNRLKCGPCYAGILTFFQKDNINYHDTLEPPVDVVPETGLERVYMMFRRNSIGEVSDQVASISQICCGSFVFGCVYGAFRNHRKDYEDYILKNETTRFVSAYQAKRKLSDHIFRKCLRDGSVMGVKCGLLALVYFTTLTVVQTYRGEGSVLQFLVAGTIAGALARTHLGLHAMIGGGTVGLIFGLSIGVFCYVAMKISGISMQEVRKWQNDMKKDRKQVMESAKKKQFIPDSTQFHGYFQLKAKQEGKIYEPYKPLMQNKNGAIDVKSNEDDVLKKKDFISK